LEKIVSKNILVVDDDPTSVRLVQGCLETNGYAVLCAGDGEEGLGILRSQQIDLIVLDIQMPKMDGFAFILEAKKLGENYRKVPIVMLTAKEGMTDLFKIEGAKEYIVKPFDPDQLLAAVKKYI
jgi:CheY-like chemotaxis protein